MQRPAQNPGPPCRRGSGMGEPRPCRTALRTPAVRSPRARGPCGSTSSMTGRTPVAAQNESRSSSSSLVPIVEPTTLSSRKKMRVSSACEGRPPLVAPEITSVPPGPQRLHGMRPGGGTDGLDHGVDPLRQPRPRLHGLHGPQLHEPASAWPRPGSSRRPAARRPCRARSRPWPHHPPRPARARSRRGAPARVGEQHAVRRQPRRGQTGGLLEGELLRLGESWPVWSVSLSLRRIDDLRCHLSYPLGVHGLRVATPGEKWAGTAQDPAVIRTGTCASGAPHTRPEPRMRV
ncbi:hypothetical protein SVIOM74S_06313 [Streptomyces violarus]